MEYPLGSAAKAARCKPGGHFYSGRPHEPGVDGTALPEAALMLEIASPAGLAASKDRWTGLTLRARIAYLEAIRAGIFRVAGPWVAAAAHAKGLIPGSPLAGEEWLAGPRAVLYAINCYLATYRALDGTGRVPLPPAARIDGREVVRVFPEDGYDRALLPGISAEVWFQPGVSADGAAADVSQHLTGQQPGRVALVLGAGNISSIPALDVLYKLFAERAVCLLKFNPVNAYLRPFMEAAFAPLIADGFLSMLEGDAAAGAQLCTDPLVDEIHVTGSARTHAAIHALLPEKPLTSELGNVSPAIVLPGRWSARELRFQAAQIATQKAHNAGFNCIAAQVLILPRNWTQGDLLLREIRAVFERMEERPEYYPGARERRETLLGAGSPLRGIVEVDPEDRGHPAFAVEAFCGALAVVRLDGDPAAYLRAAVRFANERLMGTLGANIVVDPHTARALSRELDQAVTDLRYGCIAINAWTGLGYFLAQTPWGAYPGERIDDPQSGIGVVHNAYFVEGTEKSVVRAPFTTWPTPPWFVTNRNAAEIGRRLCEFEMRKTPLTALRVALAALRG